MNEKLTTFKFYFYAAIAPPIASAIAFAIEGYFHRGNISLVYLLGVLAVASRTSIRPALICALISFFMYNFFFTEPRFSLVMIHREDILTVGFFLIMAALTGHQAARLRAQVVTLQNRSIFTRIQLELLESLTSAIDKNEVYQGLNMALSKIVPGSCFIVEAAEDQLNMIVGSENLLVEDSKCIRNMLRGKPGKGPEYTEVYQYYALSDDRETVAVVGFARTRAFMAGSVSNEMIETLIQQTCLALGRTRLVRDVQKERLEKERELLRSALLSSISHDLRTPLVSMMGSASSLIELKDSLSDDQKHELTEAIQQEARRLDSYIQKLLDMTRLGYGELRLDRDWIGLEDILSVVLRRIKPILKGQHLTTVIVPDLPLLFVHAALIEQAIYNVLENAVKYSPVGSAISIDAVERDNKIQIDISDQGSGIPIAERERVFDMFYRINDGDRHSPGTGLGLAICKGMIGAHGGDVQILDNTSGRGSVFRIEIPLIDAPQNMEARS